MNWKKAQKQLAIDQHNRRYKRQAQERLAEELSRDLPKRPLSHAAKRRGRKYAQMVAVMGGLMAEKTMSLQESKSDD